VSLFLNTLLTLPFNIQPVKASKPLAPNGVHDIVTYENRIGEQGLLIEDDDIQMWVPRTHENHSQIIFDYLVSGYKNLSSIFGDHDYPYKFSIEHYPEGSQYIWGGTDARGTIRYGYSNLEDDTPEWNQHGVPHMIGYYEEMAHCFIHDFMHTGFYETLGSMIGSEVTLRAAYNPHIESLISNSYQVFADTTSYYLQHNTGPPGVADNIWPTRVLSHVFKTEVIDVYGWSALTNTFKSLQLEDYPLKHYYRNHTWGGFLNYLESQTSSDINSIFADYGLPSLQWFEGDGYQKGMMRIDDNDYSFRLKAFDREGDQPSDVKLHVYSGTSSTYAMTFIRGNNEIGWTFEANMTLTVNYTYAFSARDSAHSIFQAVGLPTLMNNIELPKDQQPTVKTFYPEWDGKIYPVTTLSNATITNFNFNQTLKQISFNVVFNSLGFCNVTIAIELLNGDFTVWIGDSQAEYTLAKNSTHFFIYFTYSSSINTVKIIGTTVIPEFPGISILLILIALTLTILLLRKKRLKMPVIKPNS